MNLKSYLRGTGIGIMIAAIVLMASSGSTSHAMTDDEIRERAKALGMTDGSEVLLSSQNTDAGSGENSGTPAQGTEAAIEVSATEAAEVVSASSDGELPEGEEVKEEVPDLVIRGGTVSEDTTDEDAALKALEGQQTTAITSDVTGEDKNKSELLADAAETENETEAQPVKTDSGFVSITVSGGMSSTAVARALQSAGAVNSAAEFDSFLCRNGYDRKLSTGEFRIPAGSSEEDIAQILMKKK